MKRFLLICHLSFVICHSSPAQVPVTVNRSTVISGGAVVLPTISGSGTSGLGSYSQSATYDSGWCSGTTSTDGWASVSGSASGYATISPPGGLNPVLNWSVSGTPVVTISTNAPSVFTNSCSASVRFLISRGMSGSQYYVTVGAGQSYAVTIVEDGGTGGGGGGTPLPIAILSGTGDTLQSLSRKDVTTDYRKILGFQLRASTNAVTSSLAVVLSNTTTNLPPDNNFLGIRLYQDDGGGEWDSADTLLATTTNASGFAIFNGLSLPLNTTNQTFFVAASFCPTNQTRNSFISATLRSQNIVTTRAGTNTVIETTGGTILGKQYAFMDTTQAEDDAAAAALANQINTAVDGATNTLNSAWSQQLATTTDGLNTAWGQQLANATNGWSRSTGTASSKSSFSDTILPAAAAGAAAIGAAFTSDSLHKEPLSSEFLMPVK